MDIFQIKHSIFKVLICFKNLTFLMLNSQRKKDILFFGCPLKTLNGYRLIDMSLFESWIQVFLVYCHSTIKFGSFNKLNLNLKIIVWDKHVDIITIYLTLRKQFQLSVFHFQECISIYNSAVFKYHWVSEISGNVLFFSIWTQKQKQSFERGNISMTGQ